MESRQKIFFYGNSLVLAGLRARLQGCAGLEVCDLDKTALDSMVSCAVIYDMGTTEIDDLLALVEEKPGVLLIGIDPESHALLLGGQAAGNISLDQITQIIQIQDDPQT